MPLNAASIREGAAEPSILSADVQAAVRKELEIMLKAPIFSQSNRCKRFLSHIVFQTLSGNADELKERTIGISVFERTNDYDTGDDSIVRVTANDVRKRLSQYYRESATIPSIQIDLPRGSYVPEFRFHPKRQSRKPEEAGISEVNIATLTPSDYSMKHEELPPPVQKEFGGAVPEVIEPGSAPQASRGGVRLLAIVTVALIAIAAVFGIVRKALFYDVPDLWNSFTHLSSPVLVCIDTHELPDAGASTNTEQTGQTFLNMVLRKQIIALDDAAVLASMAAELGKKEIPFRVVGAEQVSLADLRRQPVILIGAIDNKWTIQLTSGLRYRIEVANPPGSGSKDQPVASIVDSQRPATRWSTDLSVPFTAWKSDYALVSRIDDSTTGVPVLIEAGLGNDGTLAASELVTSARLSTVLAKESTCRGKRNFEAVIETQIIDTKSGPPHVLRLACW